MVTPRDRFFSLQTQPTVHHDNDSLFPVLPLPASPVLVVEVILSATLDEPILNMLDQVLTRLDKLFHFLPQTWFSMFLQDHTES